MMVESGSSSQFKGNEEYHNKLEQVVKQNYIEREKKFEDLFEKYSKIEDSGAIDMNDLTFEGDEGFIKSIKKKKPLKFGDFTKHWKLSEHIRSLRLELQKEIADGQAMNSVQQSALNFNANVGIFSQFKPAQTGLETTVVASVPMPRSPIDVKGSTNTQGPSQQLSTEKLSSDQQPGKPDENTASSTEKIVKNL